MENPRTPPQIHPKVRELVDFTMLKCASAIQRISAYKLSLAELGAIREVISTAIKTAFYRGLIAQQEDREAYLEPWSYENEPTDPYIRKPSDPERSKPVATRLWNAVKRRTNSDYANKRRRAGITELLRNRRP
jgi:hypothetical protein